MATMVVDSAEGIAFLIDWARTHGFVLMAGHKRLADKYGVRTDGVVFVGQLPTTSK